MQGQSVILVNPVNMTPELVKREDWWRPADGEGGRKAGEGAEGTKN